MCSQARSIAAELSKQTEVGLEALPATNMERELHVADDALSRLVSLYGTQDPESSRGSAAAPDAGRQATDSPRSQDRVDPETDRTLHEQPEDSNAGAILDKQEHEGQHAKAAMKGSAAREGAAQADLGRAEQAQSVAAQPPAEVQGIIAKLLQFVKVRLSPLVPLWRSALLHSCGACRGLQRTAN